MTSLGAETDPFCALGLSDTFSELVINSLKRGRNGEGYGIDVNRVNRPNSSIEASEGRIIGAVVDSVSGSDAAKQVAIVVGEILKKNEES